jgi:hypothetical protein
MTEPKTNGEADLQPLDMGICKALRRLGICATPTWLSVCVQSFQKHAVITGLAKSERKPMANLQILQ